MKQTILFLRNGSLYNDVAAAKAGLAAVSHKAGQPVVALYNGKDGETTVIKLIFAIGTGEGVGKYQVLANEADFSTLSGLISDLSDALGDHIDTLAGTAAGHAKSSDDISFSNGEGTINTNAVTTAKIKDLNVTEAKIADSAVTTAKIKDLNVTTDKIANENVTYTKLQKVLTANSVLGSKSANGTVTELSASDLFDILKTDSTNWDSIVNSTIKIGTIVTDKGTIEADIFTEEGLTIKGDYSTVTTAGIEVIAENNEVLLKLGTAPAALKANTLTTERSIGLTGEVTGSVKFNGSKDVNISATIADGVTVTGWDLGASIATTPTKGDNSTSIATTSFVQTEIADKLAAADALVFKGTVEKAEDLPTITNEMVGWTYKATKAFELTSGKVEPGDMIICTGSGWSIIQTNIDGAVTGPTSSKDGEIALFDGTTGKVIKGGNITLGSVAIVNGNSVVGNVTYLENNSNTLRTADFKPSDIVLNTRQVIAGEGLTGGGPLSSDVTISHAESENTTLKDDGKGFLSTFTFDNFGHIVSLGTFNVGVENGLSETGKYISSIASSANGRGITITKSELPAESGKVKVNSSDTADYLNKQIISHTTTEEEKLNNKYGVEVFTISGALEMTVKIDTIDGGTY